MRYLTFIRHVLSLTHISAYVLKKSCMCVSVLTQKSEVRDIITLILQKNKAIKIVWLSG